jgi:hypothetical protein
MTSTQRVSDTNDIQVGTQTATATSSSNPVRVSKGKQKLSSAMSIREKPADVGRIQLFSEHMPQLKAITPEIMEVAVKNFLDQISVKHFEIDDLMFDSDLNWETGSEMPDGSDLSKIKEAVLDSAAFALLTGGKFRSNTYMIGKTSDGFIFMNIGRWDSSERSKLTYALAPRMSQMIKRNVNSAFLNILENINIIPVKGKEYCFLRSHVLAEGPERRRLKNEVQSIFDACNNREKPEDIITMTKEYKYILLKKL